MDRQMTDEEIWEDICKIAAKQAGISIERAKAILADAGFDAFDHTGIAAAVKVVGRKVGKSSRTSVKG
jgi:hypothetical protein